MEPGCRWTECRARPRPHLCRARPLHLAGLCPSWASASARCTRPWRARPTRSAATCATTRCATRVPGCLLSCARARAAAAHPFPFPVRCVPLPPPFPPQFYPGECTQVSDTPLLPTGVARSVEVHCFEPGEIHFPRLVRNRCARPHVRVVGTWRALGAPLNAPPTFVPNAVGAAAGTSCLALPPRRRPALVARAATPQAARSTAREARGRRAARGGCWLIQRQGIQRRAARPKRSSKSRTLPLVTLRRRRQQRTALSRSSRRSSSPPLSSTSQGRRAPRVVRRPLPAARRRCWTWRPWRPRQRATRRAR